MVILTRSAPRDNGHVGDDGLFYDVCRTNFESPEFPLPGGRIVGQPVYT